MRLYLITRREGHSADYDEYEAFLVCVNTEEEAWAFAELEARKPWGKLAYFGPRPQPVGDCDCPYQPYDDHIGPAWQCKDIGEAASGTERGLLLVSFKAG